MAASPAFTLQDSLPSFQEVTAAALDAMSPADRDDLSFGVVGLNSAGEVEVYNALEARLAGLTKEGVLGRHFYTAVAPCMNNRLVAGRLDAGPVDEIIDYVLTFRMRPIPVKLRLLRAPHATRVYILILR